MWVFCSFKDTGFLKWPNKCESGEGTQKPMWTKEAERGPKDSESGWCFTCSVLLSPHKSELLNKGDYSLPCRYSVYLRQETRLKGSEKHTVTMPSFAISCYNYCKITMKIKSMMVHLSDKGGRSFDFHPSPPQPLLPSLPGDPWLSLLVYQEAPYLRGPETELYSQLLRGKRTI